MCRWRETGFLLGRRGGVGYLPVSAEAHILLEGAAPRRTPRVRKNAWMSLGGGGRALAGAGPPCCLEGAALLPCWGHWRPQALAKV